MKEQDVEQYCAMLTDLGIENRAVEHPASRDISEVLTYLGLGLSDCVPTLILSADDQLIAVVIRGDTKVDWKKLKAACGIRALRMATPEEFTEATHLPLGAARVYSPGMKTVIDAKVFEKEYLTGGSGRFDCSIRVKTSDLTKIPDSVVGDITR